MKNLKKILMAFVLVALLVSSVVTVAIAEASYTGTVSAANELLDAVAAAQGDAKLTVTEAKGAALASAYKYLAESPVNPEDEGYTAMISRYNSYAFYIARALYETVDLDAEPMVISEGLAKVYSQLEKAPLPIKVTFSGMVMLVKFSQFENELFPIEVNDSGRLIAIRFLQ